MAGQGVCSLGGRSSSINNSRVLAPFQRARSFNLGLGEAVDTSSPKSRSTNLTCKDRHDQIRRPVPYTRHGQFLACDGYEQGAARNSILSRRLTPKCRYRDSLSGPTARGLISVLGSLRISRKIKTKLFRVTVELVFLPLSSLLGTPGTFTTNRSTNCRVQRIDGGRA
jgi:hypothetical protein